VEPREHLVASRQGGETFEFCGQVIGQRHSRPRRASLDRAVHRVGHVPDLNHLRHANMNNDADLPPGIHALET
jgi:hypothetical protein